VTKQVLQLRPLKAGGSFSCGSHVSCCVSICSQYGVARMGDNQPENRLNPI